MTRVITYGVDGDEYISVTPEQARMLADAQIWPRDRRGQELCRVEHGLHDGQPTYTDDELRAKFASA